MTADLPTYRLQPPDDGGPSALEDVFRVKGPDGETYYGYRWPHPAVATTVVVYDSGRDAYLLIERDIDPFRGAYSFPGGFMTPGQESVEQAAVRELREETGVEIDAARLELLDVRSHPDRDPRDHVIDIGFLAVVDGAQARAGDETAAVRWARADEIDGLELAFDHGDLWRCARRHHTGA